MKIINNFAGVQWLGNELLPGSMKVTNRLQELGKTVYFVTNMPIKTRSQLLENFQGHGYKTCLDQILSASYVTAKYLHDLKFQTKVYIIGSLGITAEFDNFGIRYIDSNDDIDSEKLNPLYVMSHGIELDEEIGAVVVSFDPNFNYSKILKASNYLKNPNCLFIGTSFDEVYPTYNGAIIPAMGPIVRAIEVASGRKATFIGKPNVNMCKSLRDEGKINPERTLMIGDSAKYDILFGYYSGFQTLLVGTGVNTLNDVHEWQQSNLDEDKKFIPDTYLPTLGDLSPFLN